jgi:hypothetical protein
VHPQLGEIVDEYDKASARLRTLVAHVPEARWQQRSDPARWSAAECIAHLNLTSRAYLPLIDAALAEVRALRDAGVQAPARYRRDLVGWFLWRTTGPPARLRTKTTAPFVPAAGAPRAETVSEFERLQREQIERVRAADGLPIERARIQSPFVARLSYNLYACLTILPRHQHRHLWQAERVWPPTAA